MNAGKLIFFVVILLTAFSYARTLRIEVLSGKVAIDGGKKVYPKGSAFYITPEAALYTYAGKSEIQIYSDKKNDGFNIALNTGQTLTGKKIFEMIENKKAFTRNMVFKKLYPLYFFFAFFIFYLFFYKIMRSKKYRGKDILFYFPLIQIMFFILSFIASQMKAFNDHKVWIILFSYLLLNVVFFSAIAFFVPALTFTPEEEELMTDLKIAAAFLKKQKPLTAHELHIIKESSLLRKSKKKIFAYHKELLKQKTKELSYE